MYRALKVTKLRIVYSRCKYLKRVGYLSDDQSSERIAFRALKGLEINHKISLETLDRFNPRSTASNRLKAFFEVCDLVVFDIAKGNPNIYYEIGIAVGLNKNHLIIADSAELITYDISAQSHIITNRLNIELIEFELFSALNSVNSTKLLQNPAHLFHDSNRSNFEKSFRRVYEYSGTRRHIQTETWFKDLISEINGFQVIENESPNKRTQFDLLLWNSTDDPDLKPLGNPIPVEITSIKSISKSNWLNRAKHIRNQGLKSLLIISSAANNRNNAAFSNTIKSQEDILMVFLDREDLIEVRSPEELYFAIKTELLKIAYGNS